MYKVYLALPIYNPCLFYGIMGCMFKKLLLISLLLFNPLKINNGYDQNTRITFNGINETCYGTLLSKTSVSGSWSSEIAFDLNAPDNVKEFFKDFKDEDNYFYLNYFQDVSDGYLYWPFYPPQDFKILLYYPDSDTFILSEGPISRYALSSTYTVTVENGSMIVERNYDYLHMLTNTLIRILICTLAPCLITLLFYRPLKKDYPLIISNNLIFQIVIHILISLYSYKNGFSIVEYFMFLWIPHLLFAFYQGHLYKNRSYSIGSAYFAALSSQAGAYAAGLLLVDLLPGLFTLI